MTDQFNKIIGGVKSIEGKVQNTIGVYKEELKKLAAEVCDTERRNKELQRKLEKAKRKMEEEKEGGLQQQKDPDERENTNSNANYQSVNLPKEDRKMWEQLNTRI